MLARVLARVGVGMHVDTHTEIQHDTKADTLVHTDSLEGDPNREAGESV